MLLSTIQYTLVFSPKKSQYIKRYKKKAVKSKIIVLQRMNVYCLNYTI